MEKMHKKVVTILDSNINIEDSPPKKLRGQQQKIQEEISRLNEEFQKDYHGKKPNNKDGEAADDENAKTQPQPAEEFVAYRWSMANPHDKSNEAARGITLVKEMKGKAGFQSFEELMTEIKHEYRDEKQTLDNQVLVTIR